MIPIIIHMQNIPIKLLAYKTGMIDSIFKYIADEEIEIAVHNTLVVLK